MNLRYASARYRNRIEAAEGVFQRMRDRSLQDPQTLTRRERSHMVLKSPERTQQLSGEEVDACREDLSRLQIGAAHGFEP